MTDENPSILSHVSIGTNNFARAVAFYDKVLPTLGCKRLMEHPGAIAYGKQFPEFWVQTPINGKRASLSNGIHVGFVAQSKKRYRTSTKLHSRLGVSTTVHQARGQIMASRTTDALSVTLMATRLKLHFGMLSLPVNDR